MSCESHYEINIWRVVPAGKNMARSEHYCKIRLPSGISKEEAIERAQLTINSHQRIDDAFRGSLTHWDCKGYNLELNQGV